MQTIYNRAQVLLRIGLIAAALLCASCIASVVMAAPSGSNSKSLLASTPWNSQDGYMITPPADWTIHTPMEGDKFDIVFLSPLIPTPAPPFDDNITVIRSKSAPGETIESAPKKLHAAYARAYTGYKMIKDAFIMVNGEKAYTLAYTYSYGTPARKLFTRQFIFIHNGVDYIATGTSLASREKERDPAFVASFESFQLTP